MMPFSISELESAREQLGDLVKVTPTVEWLGAGKDLYAGASTEVFVKLELFQFGGSFKPRGALCAMLELDADQLSRGVTAISAGNHAIAVSYGAQVLGTNAKVVMPSYAPELRVKKSRELGTEVVLVDDIGEGFELVKQIEKDEGRTFIHPFDGPRTVLGTGTCGLEFYRQSKSLDMAILPVGGGGLAAGMSAAIKLCNPECQVFGVEPIGADSMAKSFQTGQTAKLDKIDTIAKSLGAPFSLPHTFDICRHNIQEIVLVSDDELCRSMAIMFHELKLVTEPAAAATMAALTGPLKKIADGKRVGIIACGSNIDRETFSDYVARGERLL